MMSFIIAFLMRHYWGDQIKMDERGRECDTHGGQERCIQVLVGKPERNIPLGRPRHICCIIIINFWISLNVGNFLTG
jgi:hypothetical protein